MSQVRHCDSLLVSLVRGTLHTAAEKMCFGIFLQPQELNSMRSCTAKHIMKDWNGLKTTASQINPPETWRQSELRSHFATPSMLHALCLEHTSVQL